VSEDHFEELLGPYLLRQLTAEDEHELERHLEECPKCRDELAQIRQTHNLLRQLAVSEPPAELKSRTMAHARGESLARSGVRWMLWVPAAAALLVATVLDIGLLHTMVGDSSAKALPLNATALAPGASGELRGEKVGENFQVQLEVRGLPKLQKGEYYEMWYAKDGGGRISCGTFRTQPEGRTTVNLTAPVNAVSYPKIEVTREPDNGNPRASGKEVLVGDLRNL
jgi:Anti-sigma-K factor rskA/Putative zinc-finger